MCVFKPADAIITIQPQKSAQPATVKQVKSRPAPDTRSVMAKLAAMPKGVQ